MSILEYFFSHIISSSLNNSDSILPTKPSTHKFKTTLNRFASDSESKIHITTNT